MILMSQTLILLKPDCLQKKLVQKVLEVFEKNGLKILKQKKFKPSKQLITKLYHPLQKKPFIKAHVEFVSSGNCIIAILKGKNAVKKARRLIGIANPKKARKGTIRARFGKIASSGVFHNIAHSSDSRKEFKRECRIFKKLL